MDRARVGVLNPGRLPFLYLSLNRFTPHTASVETFDGMKAAIPRLRKKLGADPEYFRRVYLYTFDFARSEGQRSLPLDMALAFWGLLLPLGLKGGALRHSPPGDCDDYFMRVDDGVGGWTEGHTQLWYDFLNAKDNIKGISKDTWAMVRLFCFYFFSPTMGKKH
jgi:DCN1-like protein 1/2